MSESDAVRSSSSLADAVKDAYAHGQEDERLEPLVVVAKGQPTGRFRDGDSIIFYDIRGEREIELSRALVDSDFKEFPVMEGLNLNLVTMIQYDKDLSVDVAFPPLGEIQDTLSHVLSKNKIRHAKIVESEKAVHLSYFFNGKSAAPMPLEKRIIIPSTKVSAPDLLPKMNIAGVTKEVIKTIYDYETGVIIANLANVDVVGHTENENAILASIEAVDNALGEICAIAKKENVTTIVTADHGTVESWLYPDGTIDTGHTNSLVPFIIMEPDEVILPEIKVLDGGELSDVAPTILSIMGLSKPEVMTGSSLVSGSPYDSKKRVLLLILDGWGVKDDTTGNLIYKAHTMTMDDLLEKFPSTRLTASQEAVGMPKGSVGNSEVGHLHLGAGRRIPSDRVRIDTAIEDVSFYENRAFLGAMENVKVNKKNLHLLGIVSFYSSHGSIEHLYALLEMAKNQGVENVYIHGFLGRRGEHAQSGARYVHDIVECTKKLNLGEMVTVVGRHWALDREHNWDRVKKTYDALVLGKGEHISTEEVR
jgi:2,3-bisphosphoglycerate-independent phosphoglycerate mutase